MTVPVQTLAAGSLVQSVDWLAIAPPVTAAVFGLVVLVADLFLPEARKRLLGLLSAAGLVLAALPLLWLRGETASTFCLADAGGAGPADACSYVADSFTVVMQFLVLASAFVTALLSMTSVRELRLPEGEFWFLLLSATAGAALVPASRDVVTLVIALEVASLPAFALVGLRRGDRRSSEAALKFFLSSVAATAVTLLGASFVYAATGSLHFSQVADGLDATDPRLAKLAAAGVVLTLVGFAFKAAAVPFHFWVPETYVGAPVPVAAFLSVVGKAAGISGLVMLCLRAFAAEAHLWGPVVAVLAALTMTTGNVAAVRQRPERGRSAVRLLAWSSVGQVGYLLVPLAAAAYTADSDPRAALATVGATIGYFLMYAAVNLGAFAVVAHIARTRPANRLDDYRGLYRAHPLTAVVLGFFLLCLAGLPPGLIGLFTKVAIFSTAVEAGLGWLAVLTAANVVVALYYYLRWTAYLFRPAPEPAPEQRTGPSRIPGPLAAAIALTAVTAVVLSLDPQLVLTHMTAAGH
ncbi:NADH-quinone oxidoreductase subunit N [Streptomyces sp. HNM0574]|uniref:NADH-quinone oxidoreductase subunit N n=1 Tax=Streptomyces sp. HNM0574 TaxID=2714954 RepID=UPI00146AE167|nr:NADH-quinone oxidoreductase subunit N [Streptomyces sp. HNM0574]NLU66978.1 NADH-quinone oxidoreductase subunit N [Streptomyces sp. HNM0574]